MDKEEHDPRSQTPCSAASPHTMVESRPHESTTHEAEADLDMLVHDLDPEFSNSSGSEILDDREMEVDILVF